MMTNLGERKYDVLGFQFDYRLIYSSIKHNKTIDFIECKFNSKIIR